MEVQFITSVAVITPNPTADGCTSTHSDLKGTCCAVEDVGESCKGGPAAATPVQGAAAGSTSWRDDARHLTPARVRSRPRGSTPPQVGSCR